MHGFQLVLDASSDVAAERKQALLRAAATSEFFTGYHGQFFVSEGCLGFFCVDGIDEDDNLICVDMTHEYQDISSEADELTRQVFADSYIEPTEDFHVLVPLSAIVKWVIW